MYPDEAVKAAQDVHAHCLVPVHWGAYIYGAIPWYQPAEDTLAEAQFSPEKVPETEAVKERIYECDLLIIDDLGTEMTNSFVGTELFTIINERYNSRRSVIISTNLELSLLRDRYSDRIFSRLTGSYDILKLSGPDLRSAL